MPEKDSEPRKQAKRSSRSQRTPHGEVGGKSKDASKAALPEANGAEATSPIGEVEDADPYPNLKDYPEISKEERQERARLKREKYTIVTINKDGNEITIEDGIPITMDIKIFEKSNNKNDDNYRDRKLHKWTSVSTIDSNAKTSKDLISSERGTSRKDLNALHENSSKFSEAEIKGEFILSKFENKAPSSHLNLLSTRPNVMRGNRSRRVKKGVNAHNVPNDGNLVLEVPFVDKEDSTNIHNIREIIYILANNNYNSTVLELVLTIAGLPEDEKLRVSKSLQEAIARVWGDGSDRADLSAVVDALDKVGSVGHTDASLKTKQLVPPEQAPALYVPRKSGKASEFLAKHYSRWLEAGTLYQHHIRRLDKRLLDALDREFKGDRDGLRALLPPKTVETERLVAPVSTGPLSPKERSRLGSELRAGRGPKLP